MSSTATKRSLVHPNFSSVPRSMPLIIPNDTRYDISTNTLVQIPGEKRISLKTVPETLRLLETIQRPLAVLAIGGPCRSGKSYILSRMLGSADDFALGHTYDPQTLGIWIGTTVLDHGEYTILLMDTEGIDSVFAKSRDDACLLVMTILLSSHFIYNSIGVPHHTDLEQMSYFANLASSIVVKKSPEGDENAFDFKKHFPDFLWLLRDVHLLPTGDNGSEVTPTEYLVSKVLRRGKSFKESRSDEVGRAILTFFPTIECKSIQSPSSNPEVVRDIARRKASLDPKFNEQVEQLVRYLLQRVRTKKGFATSNLVDGPILAAMADDFLKTVNDPDAVPCINDTWNAAVEKRCQQVLKNMIEEYTREIEIHISDVGLPIEEDSPDDAVAKPCSLFGIHRSILLKKTETLLNQVSHLVSASTDTFNKESLVAELDHCTARFDEEQVVGEIEAQPVKKKVIGGILLKFAEQNCSKSRSACHTLFEKLYEQKIQEKISGGQYSFDELSQDLKTLQLDYFRKAVGPAKWEVYNEKRGFIQSQKQSFKLLKGFQQKSFEAIQKAADERAKAAELADNVGKLQVQMRNDAELNQKRMEAIQNEHNEEMKRLHKEEADRIELDRKKYEDLTKAHMQEMAELSKEHQKEMKEQHDSMLEKMDKIMTQNKEEISVLSDRVNKLTADTAGARNGHYSWGDMLVSVAEKALTAVVAAASCSIM